MAKKKPIKITISREMIDAGELSFEKYADSYPSFLFVELIYRAIVRAAEHIVLGSFAQSPTLLPFESSLSEADLTALRERLIARYFTPWKLVLHADLTRLEEPAAELQPHLAKPPAINEIEAFLAKLFLRRYVSYCAKRRRYSQMQGAATSRDY